MFEYPQSVVLAFVLWVIIKFSCCICGMDPVQVYLFFIAVEFFVHEAKEARELPDRKGEVRK